MSLSWVNAKDQALPQDVDKAVDDFEAAAAKLGQYLLEHSFTGRLQSLMQLYGFAELQRILHAAAANARLRDSRLK